MCTTNSYIDSNGSDDVMGAADEDSVLERFLTKRSPKKFETPYPQNSGSKEVAVPLEGSQVSRSNSIFEHRILLKFQKLSSF